MTFSLGNWSLSWKFLALELKKKQTKKNLCSAIFFSFKERSSTQANGNRNLFPMKSNHFVVCSVLGFSFVARCSCVGRYLFLFIVILRHACLREFSSRNLQTLRYVYLTDCVLILTKINNIYDFSWVFLFFISNFLYLKINGYYL